MTDIARPQTPYYDASTRHTVRILSPDSTESRVELVRMAGAAVPVYVQPETPLWFVPSPSLDRMLLDGSDRPPRGAETPDRVLDRWDLERILTSCRREPYSGPRVMELKKLRELWLHVTNACNLRCAHCLFSCGPGPAPSLPLARMSSLVEEAYGLGCRLVLFTGGEPLLVEGLSDLLATSQARPDLTLAVLTNGLLIPSLFRKMRFPDPERLHFQVSLDGSRDFHEGLRGKGSYDGAIRGLNLLMEQGFPCSIAMTVTSDNVGSMAEVVRTSHAIGVRAVHYLWCFRRGKAEGLDFPSMESLIRNLSLAESEARRLGVVIDNIEAMRSQVFSPPGTRFDLGNAGWESLAVGPDGFVYPTPALVGREALRAGSIDVGLERIWRHSELFERIRRFSLFDIPEMAEDPWRLITGGGDLDHCLSLAAQPAGSEFNPGPDPYAPLYRAMARMVIEEETAGLPAPPSSGLILKMGDVMPECPPERELNFTHCNCLLSVGGSTTHLVREFYSERAATTDASIRNPVHYSDEEAGFIPEEARLRAYGCGSPVGEAALVEGETVVDLGSGAGAECFVAARAVGPRGRVIGVDMTAEMLALARQTSVKVAERLGYSNVEFVEGFLEDIPLESRSADVVVSNCVVNLSRNKRRVFQEIFRILKPGGRIVISDVATETEPPLEVRSDHRLIGECIGGAQVQDYLFGMLRDTGFQGARALKRFPYRSVGGHDFHSLTFAASKPPAASSAPMDVVYAGPFRAVVLDDGTVLNRGVRRTLRAAWQGSPEDAARAGIFFLDQDTGAITNVDAVCDCNCGLPPEPAVEEETSDRPATGCLECGAPLVYQSVPEDRVCIRCGRVAPSDAICENGHFICDFCHAKDPSEVIERVCLLSMETDMLRLFEEVRSHRCFPMHGPEHHGLVPGVILSAFRNSGGDLTREAIVAGIRRGAMVPGGACAFMGTCGAATGVGVAFSMILEATPLTPSKRRDIQSLVADVIKAIAERKAARCCRRESYIALRIAAARSKELLSVTLKAEDDFSCSQYAANRECIGSACPVFPKREDVSLSPIKIVRAAKG